MKVEHEKCGEIFRRGPGLYIFCCAYCSDYFDSIERALSHIESHFLFQPEPICMEQINSGSIELSSMLLNNIQEIQIDEKNAQPFNEYIDVAPLKIETQDPFLSNFTADENINYIKYESELVPEIKEAELSKHVKSKHKKEKDAFGKKLMTDVKKIIKCDLCGNEMQRGSFLQHLQKRHGLCKPTVQQNSKKAIKKSSKNDELKQWYLNRRKLVKCNLCGKELKKQAIGQHIKRHAENAPHKTIVKCNKCGKTMKQTSLNRHLKIFCEMNPDNSIKWSEMEWGPPTAKMLLECDLCGKKMHKRGIRYHLQSHPNLNDCTCSICQKVFRDPMLLRAHKKIHLEHKKYCCQICGHQFHRSSNLIQHIRTHTGEKLYKCDVCDKRFAQSYTITLHMRTHTGERPYTCEICGQTFVTNSSYCSHKNRQHFNKGIVNCEVCGHLFKRGESLRQHRRIHTGERPYTCEICNLSFARRFTYKQHQVIHTGEKPHKCRFCDKKFAQAAARRWHERTIHKDPKREKNCNPTLPNVDVQLNTT